MVDCKGNTNDNGGEAFMEPKEVFSALPIIETNRVLLRMMSLDDIKDIFEYASDPEVARYVTWDLNFKAFKTQVAFQGHFSIGSQSTLPKSLLQTCVLTKTHGIR